MVPRFDAFSVYKLLPQTNCKKCGETNCMAFAVKLVSQKITLDECTPLFEEVKHKKNLAKLQEIVAPLAKARETGIVLDENKCIGCGNCVVACPPNVFVNPKSAKGLSTNNEKDSIFVVKDGKARIANLSRCRRYEPPITLCRVCEVYCFSEAIKIMR